MTADPSPVEAHRSDNGPGGAQPALEIDAFPGGVRAALEAVLMVVEEPVPVAELAAALDLPERQLLAELTAMEQEYAEQQRGFQLRPVAGGWRFYSRPDYAPIVERFILEGQQARLSQAALETLAIVAYLQPVTRGRVSSVRGVNVESVLRTLLTRGLVEEAPEHGEGGSILYRTTNEFLERMGLDSLDELPPIAQHLPATDLLDELADQGSR